MVRLCLEKTSNLLMNARGLDCRNFMRSVCTINLKLNYVILGLAYKEGLIKTIECRKITTMLELT